MASIAVVGASGFVGAAVSEAVLSAGHQLSRVRAPRVDKSEVNQELDLEGNTFVQLCSRFKGVDAVINCAGKADASENDQSVLVAANALSPAVVAAAARIAGVPRLVHVSSAAVQGRSTCLDNSETTDEFTPYSYSKAEGERLVRREFSEAVIYRPPGVHGQGRRVSFLTARIAASPLASVAAPGNQPSPQALIGNVASALLFLALSEFSPPRIVIHPWEGLTVTDVMAALGGKPPITLPRGIAQSVARVLELGGRRSPLIAANARRIEMLWFGQGQAESWLTTSGWYPPQGKGAWVELGEVLRHQ